MSTTTVQSGDTVAIKHYSVALFVQTQKTPSAMKNLTGPAPKQADTERKLKLQTSPDMPIVRVQDLAKGYGDTVSVDCVNIIGGKPIMGDRNAEGKGEKLSFSSMDVKIDLATKPIDAGGKMAQQRTRHQLRTLALANATGYMARLESQLCHIHLGGARGTLNYQTYPIPLDTDPQFSEIVVNDMKAPSRNRHYVVSGGTTLKNGGENLNSVTSSDVMKLDIIDQLRLLLDELELPLQPVKIADDPAANDDPMWLLLCPPRVFDSIKTASGSNLRTFQQTAWNRASYGSKHPLFMGDVGMWNGILVRKVNDFWIRFLAGETIKYVASGDTSTGTESSTTAASGLSTTHAVERSLLLGAQALANCYGRTQSTDYHYSWLERRYNFNRGLEVAAEMMGGKAKLRFEVPQPDGSKVVTDHGVLVVDSVVKL